MNYIELIAAVAASYLLGSIPFGLVMTRAMGLVDPRRIGSGNIGASNVLRTGSKTAAAGTVLLDGGKGLVAVLICGAVLGADAARFAAIAAFLGHLFPIWLRFRGGKGVATYLGVILALSFPAAALTCLVWLTAAALSRISSVAALVSAALAPLFIYLLSDLRTVAAVALMSALIFARHQKNIRRLLSGTEPRINLSLKRMKESD
ncbi:MAG: glycerol-3-phosphate 1-O-acyltransferase PlsY [Rhodobacteraceae bacterium]|nr:glycerol-3-phosphate 1-O-acyltransferase PlsY [Paracoccaceae bacterium]